MKVHEPSWMFSALIRCYVPKRWTCRVPKSRENRIIQNKGTAIAHVKHPGASAGLKLEDLPRSRCVAKNPHSAVLQRIIWRKKKKKTNTKNSKQT